MGLDSPAFYSANNAESNAVGLLHDTIACSFIFYLAKTYSRYCWV